MTEETAIERPDYSKPPPGYRLVERSGVCIERWYFQRLGVGILGRSRKFDDEGDALTAVWAHYKAEHDPPQFLITGDEEADAGGPGNAAWLLPTGLTSDSAIVYHDGHTSTAEARGAAWAWYDRRLALAAALEGGCFCPECNSQEAHVEAIDASTSSQPWCVECDVEMGGLFDDIWPRCLTWSDEQVAEVEHWLQDSTAEMPEVLHSPDDEDGETIIGGPDDVGRIGWKGEGAS